MSKADDIRFVIVGDNIDKRVAPRNMRIDHQVKSIHYFHSYASKSLIPSNHLDSCHPQNDILRLSPSAFVPTVEDCSAIRDNYVILVAHIIVKHMAFFSCTCIIVKHVLFLHTNKNVHSDLCCKSVLNAPTF